MSIDSVARFIDSRDVLKKRLDHVFGDPFRELYPDLNPPQVFLGNPVTEPPFYVAVDEIIDAAETDGGATMGHGEITWQLHVFLSAQHSSLETAANTLLAYEETIFAAVLADPQLNRTADNASPFIEQAGTAGDTSKYYIAAGVVGVTCKRYSACPAVLSQAVKEANQND